MKLYIVNVQTGEKRAYTYRSGVGRYLTDVWHDVEHLRVEGYEPDNYGKLRYVNVPAKQWYGGAY